MVLHSEHSGPSSSAADEVVALVREALALAGLAGYLEGRVDYAPTVNDEAMARARATQQQATDAQASAFHALYTVLSR